MRLYSLLPILLTIAVLIPGSGLAGQSPQQDPRQVVVISDLHMGNGRDAAGNWYPHEDFRWAPEFELFLDALSALGNNATDLILNGDTFELLQPTSADCTYEDPSLGCSETALLARLDLILAAHASEIAALGKFARAGTNRVVLVPGDHDAALLFPTVGQRAVTAFGAPSDRVMVARGGFWRSADGLVHVEHGHQIEFRSERFEEWPSPFITRDGRQHLTRPIGHQTVQPLFNEYEQTYPIIDNLADESAGVRYTLSATGVTDVAEQAAFLLRYLLFRMSWQQFRMDLDRGDVEPPLWNLAEVRAEGPVFLVESLPDDNRFKPLAADALEAGHLNDLLDGLSDNELLALCDQRAAIRRARRRFERVLTQLAPVGPQVLECPRTPDTTGPIFDYFWQSRDRLFLRHLERLPVSDRPLAVFVHGHTHLADRRQGNFALVEADKPNVMDGFSPVRDAITPVVINSGAWQRTVTPVILDRAKEEREISDRELLETLQPEHLPPCYSFVQIDAYDDRPELPALRYWRQGEDEQWTVARGCPRSLSE